MIQNLKNIVLGRPAAETIEIRLSRACRVRTRENELIDGIAGEIYRVSPKTAEDVQAAGACEILPTDEQAKEREVRAAEIEKLIPGPVDPDPVPDYLLDLPQPFADWWNLKERRRVLARRADLIMERFKDEWGNITEADEKLENCDRIGDIGQRRQVVDRLLQGRVRILQDDPRRFERIKRLQDALYRAWQALHELDDETREARWRAKVQAGDLAMEQAGRLTRAVRELCKVGFQIYQTRVAPLGLIENEERRLFRQSLDGQRFIREEPTVHDLRLAWSDNGTPRHFLAMELPQMASTFRSWRDLADRIEADLKDAKRELKATQKAAA